ncbi:MAG: hypothetical protein GIW94_13195 [Candidatus Eremiobacteraeota bacterium]|nr:hypothetical protein [Candidatus Eremiobacteraeota bacterium]
MNAGADGVGAGATGNIGVNVAAGAFNNQANATLISAPGNMGQRASIRANQNVSGLRNILTANTNASATGNTFNGASGNLSLNVAAGVGNQQSNSLVVQP